MSSKVPSLYCDRADLANAIVSHKMSTNPRYIKSPKPTQDLHPLTIPAFALPFPRPSRAAIRNLARPKVVRVTKSAVARGFLRLNSPSRNSHQQRPTKDPTPVRRSHSNELVNQTRRHDSRLLSHLRYVPSPLLYYTIIRITSQ